jgi:predicted MFS family arabinose efflux permease
VRRWLPLVILALAQFIMVLESSVMSVSISQIVSDLDTTVTGVQFAITALFTRRLPGKPAPGASLAP